MNSPHYVYHMLNISEVSCGHPGDVQNAHIAGSSYSYQDKVTYTCNRGYQIKSGNTERRCEANKMWSGSQPTCESE